jgi:prophage maintenance system killer protein
MTPISITVDQIIGIHDAALARYGGLPGIRQEGCLDQVHGNAMLAEQYMGNEDGSLGLCFIGSLMFYLIKGQCFVDVNKRTGLGVALFLLGALGITLSIDEIALKEHCENIATDTKMASGDVVRWLSENIVQNEIGETE